MTRSALQFALNTATLLACSTVFGQQGHPPRAGFPSPPPHVLMERLSRMSPEERQKMLDRLPADRRDRLEARLREFEAMTPEQRERLRRQYADFQQLSPEKRDEIRGLFKRFSEVPPDRRRQLGRELNRLRNLPPDRRTERLTSEQLRSEYSDQEREMLEGLAELPPPPPPIGHRRRGPGGSPPPGFAPAN